MKLIYSLIFLFSMSHADTLNYIAIKVDGNIITYYDILEARKVLKLSKEEVEDILIKEKLQENTAKKLGINISERQLDEEVNRIMLLNGMTLEEFTEALKRENLTLETYKEKYKENLLKRELANQILRDNSHMASEDDLKKFYNEHIDKFSKPKSIKVMSYSSSSPTLLQRFLERPLILIQGVHKREEVLQTSTLPPELLRVFLNTKEGGFTPIINSPNGLVSFQILEKLNVEVQKFEEIIHEVQNEYANFEQANILEDYFSKIKKDSSIEYFNRN